MAKLKWDSEEEKDSMFKGIKSRYLMPIMPYKMLCKPFQ